MGGRLAAARSLCYKSSMSQGGEEFPGARLGVLASGRGSNLQALLDAQEAGRLAARVAVVISDRSDAWALERARRHAVPALFLDSGSTRVRLGVEAETELAAALQAHAVDFVVLAGYFRIVGPVLLGAFENRVLNIHPSLLPSFPGLHAPRQALAYGVKIAGCTVHLVTRDVDAGPILRQAAVPVHPDDDEETLATRILAEEHRILVEAVNEITTRRWRLDGRVVQWDRP